MKTENEMDEAQENEDIGTYEFNRLALEIVKLLDGHRASEARAVLRRAGELMDATQRIDCGSTGFRQAVAELQAVSRE